MVFELCLFLYIKKTFVPSFKWREWDTESYKKATENSLSNLLSQESYTTSSCEVKYDNLINALTSSLETTCPKTRENPCPWKSFYWNPKCSDAKKDLNQRERLHTHLAKQGTSPAILESIGVQKAREANARVQEQEKNLKIDSTLASIDLHRNPREGWKK